ncbi:MAG: hypothetical protein ACLP50_27690, partial [Solirubrobacteraceae bacterium]
MALKGAGRLFAPTVVNWQGRYAHSGIKGLKDAPRSGRPLTHGPRSRTHGPRPRTHGPDQR